MFLEIFVNIKLFFKEITYFSLNFIAKIRQKKAAFFKCSFV